MTDELRKQYREQMIAEDDKRALADNCRLALDRFFMAFPPKKKRIINSSDILIVLAPLIAKGFTIKWKDVRWQIYDIETIKEIRQYSWWKEGVGGLTYTSDFADCEDFSDLAKSLWAMFWNTNSLGSCEGFAIYNGESTPHNFDILICIDENDKIKAYLFDTQFNTEPTILTDNLVSVNKTSWKITNTRI